MTTPIGHLGRGGGGPGDHVGQRQERAAEQHRQRQDHPVARPGEQPYGVRHDDADEADQPGGGDRRGGAERGGGDQQVAGALRVQAEAGRLVVADARARPARGGAAAPPRRSARRTAAPAARRASRRWPAGRAARSRPAGCCRSAVAAGTSARRRGTRTPPPRPGSAWPATGSVRRPRRAPMITMPRRAGTATQSAVRISGDARTSVFCQENEVPKPPRHKQREELDRRFAEQDQEDREERRRRQHGERRDDHRLGRARDAPHDVGGGRDARRCFDFGRRGRGHGISRLRLGSIRRRSGGRRGGRTPAAGSWRAQVIEPTTPSARKLMLSIHGS